MIPIAFYHSLISKLFGNEPKEAEEAGPPVQAAPEEVSPASHELHLSQDHAIHRLWSLRVQQAGWLPQPALCLVEQPGLKALLPEGEIQRELPRLQMTVNSSANSRLRQIQPKGTGATGESEPPDLDAQAVVFIASSGLAAWLLAYPPVGQGAELDRAILDQALEAAGIRFGLDKDLLDSLPQDPDRYFHLFPCARGEPVVHGEDGRVVDFFPRVVERKFLVDERNRVDYTALNIIHNVKEGDEICKLVPPTEGEAGRTVLDEPIPAKAGKTASLPKGRHTAISEDGLCLVATIAGHVEFSGRAFQVKPLMNIPGNVDYSTGDINFLGDVYVHGDIGSGFTVRAMGNITVCGVVEACTVEAGGDLVVSGGVQGDGQAVIRAQRGVYAKFIENACVYAKELVYADCLINCDVYCDGTAEIRSGRMTVIGGALRAAREVTAGTIGSRAECRTEIILGGMPCWDFEYHILLQEISDLEKELVKTERQPDSPVKLSSMSKMRMQLMVDQKKLAQLNQEREPLAAEAASESSPRRMVCDTVYPGTVLTIGDSTPYQFECRCSPCTATLADGEICFL
ncbi:MAG: FapA family protein [Oscillospiraceae bacterium]|nr:FapA family protein [Oscillospiraceae bacterium]